MSKPHTHLWLMHTIRHMAELEESAVQDIQLSIPAPCECSATGMLGSEKDDLEAAIHDYHEHQMAKTALACCS